MRYPSHRSMATAAAEIAMENHPVAIPASPLDAKQRTAVMESLEDILYGSVCRLVYLAQVIWANVFPIGRWYCRQIH